ncbi:hypothetical protein [Denitromonas halophila]|uniref:Uncharacterized protein n=1 Tax=Denitromonas halophila TaxID=1629404 RepID=A0A557QLN7_9RHOO|nr:hypothetical protein [Denitromonas halophila]TVO53821.1 hypothetical protein FHP91_13570 [Denitromonas halophila]
MSGPLQRIRSIKELERERMKRSGIVEHVVLMPMRIHTQWEDGKLVAMMPGWQLPPGRFLVEGDNMEDALNKLESMMRQYWGAPYAGIRGASTEFELNRDLSGILLMPWLCSEVTYGMDWIYNSSNCSFNHLAVMGGRCFHVDG